MIESKYVSFEMPASVNELIAVEVDKTIESFVSDAYFRMWNKKDADVTINVLLADDLEIEKSLCGLVADYVEMQKNQRDGRVVSTDPVGLRELSEKFRKMADMLDEAANCG